MRIAALAAMLAVAHGTAGPAAAGDREHVRGPGFSVGPLDRSSPSGSLSASDRRALGPVAQASRDQVQRERDARCGCNSADAGQAGRAGF